MKIALFGPVYPWRGGIAHYTTLLAAAIRRHGHDTLLISFRRQYPAFLFPGRSDRDPSQRPLYAEDACYWIDSLNPFTWLMTFRRLYAYRPDLLILQWWTTFWAPLYLTLGVLNRILLGAPLVYLCHNVLPHEAREGDRLVARAVLRLGSHFIVQSTAEEARLRALLPWVRASIAPLPVYTIGTGERLPKREARRRLALPEGVPVLLFFGIVRPYKGLDLLLAALPLVRARIGDVRLIVAGEFWEPQRRYREQMQSLGIEAIVVIDDRYIPDEETPLYFSAADLLVAPYRHVTASAVVQMAKGFGLPTVSTADLMSEEAVDSADVTIETLASAICDALEREVSVLPAAVNVKEGVGWNQLVMLLERMAEVA